MLNLTDKLKRESHRLGFSLAGVCPAVAPPGISKFHEWLAAGFAGEMRYLVDRADAYEHPSHVLDGVRSVLMLTMNYRTHEPAASQPGQGRIARYAWGEADYHDLIHSRLHDLVHFLQQEVPGSLARGVVDTAPLLEREFAQLAGLGWIGKNTLLLNKREGSWFFLAALLTDQQLEFDTPHATDHCGTCTACLDACPTNAFPQPYVLDATKCISYLTIEQRGSIPLELRPGIGEWLFGCDVCQEVCPWNHRAPQSDQAAFAPRNDSNPVDLIELFWLDDSAFRDRFRHTPLWRSKRRGILRNAAIVLGNQRPPRAIPALVRGLHDSEPLIRSASAWALGQYSEPAAREQLQTRLAIETDNVVRQEIQRELHLECGDSAPL